MLHPLGNCSVNSYDGLVVTTGELLIDHVQDLAEIPTAQAEPRVDADGLPAWAAARCRAAVAAFRVTVDGSPVATVSRSSMARKRPGQAGLPTLRLECRMAAAARGGESIVFRDDAVAGTVGWHEVTARGDRMTLTASNVPTTSRSGRLTGYPADLLSAPVDQRGADLRVRPGGRSLAAGLGVHTGARLDLPLAGHRQRRSGRGGRAGPASPRRPNPRSRTRALSWTWAMRNLPTAIG